MYEIDERLSFNGELCTVKYVGSIPQWGSGVLAIGIEWDNSTRGKNNGCLDNIRYFTCRVENSGSFIKCTRKPDTRNGFYEALQKKYLYSDRDEYDPIKVGRSKVIETVGIDKVAQYHAHISKLEMISLSRNCVFGLGPLNPTFSLDSLTRLDLSYNLVSTIDRVVEVVRPLKSLTSLVLNGNRFKEEIEKEVEGLELSRITDLSLASCLITSRQIALYLTKIFVSAEILNISNNALGEIPAGLLEGELSNSLRSIDLSWNEIESLDNVRMENGEQLTELNLSHNNIAHIKYPLRAEVLDLGYNLLTDWESFEKIGSNKALKSLQINDNPVLGNSSSGTDNSLLIIARCQTVTKFNGSNITDKERTEAELYFMSKVSSGQHPLDKENSSLWKSLVRKHGEPAVSSKPIKDTIKSRLLNLQVTYKSNTETFKVLKSTSIQKLRVTIAKKFGVSPFELVLKQLNQTLESNIDSLSDVIDPEQPIIVEDK